MSNQRKMQCMIGLVIAMGLTGGSTNWFLSHAIFENSGGELEKVKALLLVHNPGQISYISFPVAGTFATQLGSEQKIVRFPGERSISQNRIYQ